MKYASAAIVAYVLLGSLGGAQDRPRPRPHRHYPQGG